MMRGILRSREIQVFISHIQQCISEIDPIYTALRWAAPTSRMHYTVPKWEPQNCLVSSGGVKAYEAAAI